jgi:4-hydroxy-3-methylbut-2-enyl diphosphate reductase
MSADTINLTADPNRVPHPAVTGDKPPLEILLCAPRGF